MEETEVAAMVVMVGKGVVLPLLAPQLQLLQIVEVTVEASELYFYFIGTLC